MVHSPFDDEKQDEDHQCDDDKAQKVDENFRSSSVKFHCFPFPVDFDIIIIIRYYITAERKKEGLS